MKNQCKNGHKYTKENTYHTSVGTVQCRTCDRKRKADKRASVETAVYPTFGKSPWETTPEVPTIEAEPEEEPELKIPKKLIPKERPLENQARIPFFPAGGIFVDSDNHFPTDDKAATRAKLKFVQAMRPDLWINAGDLFDFYLASRYDKEAARVFGSFGITLQAEIDAARPYAEEICQVVKQAHFIPGNHCHRFEKLIDANPALYGLRSMGWSQILDYPKNFYVHPYGTRLRVNDLPLYVVHGDQIVPERVSAPAPFMLNKRNNQTTIFGHNHKLGEAYRTSYDQDRNPIIYGAVNIGHGCDITQQTYAGPEPDWATGFCYVEVYKQNGKARFSIHLIKIIDGSFKFAGVLYDGNQP